MKRLIFSVLAILLAVGTVSASAYALFSDTVNVAGVSISSGNADLEVTDVGTDIPVSWISFAGALSQKLGNLYPGQIDGTWMNFTNKSKSDIDLNLSAQLTSVSGDWSSLYNKIQFAIVDKTHTVNTNPPDDSEWHDLNWWRDAPRSFGATLDGTEEYRLFIRVKQGAGNEIAGKSLSNLTLTFTGTQKSP